MALGEMNKPQWVTARLDLALLKSVREAGATLYINFGRRWTQDFAVTISRRNMAAFEAAGVPFKSLERKRVRVLGWVEQRGGPRIHASWAGQIEVVGN